ncbi:MAG: hypothetical protein M3Q76_04415 [Acidobacteriota bacterium]|nr:hypothetical protein [Acidobacteriota bacterium]
MNALASYRALNAEQKQLLRVKQIAAELTPDEWLTLLKPVAAYDTSGDRARTLAVVLLVISIPMLFGSIFLYAVLSILGILLTLVALALLVLSIVIYVSTRRLNLEADLGKFVLPLIAVVREDVRPGERLRLRMDLRGGTIKEKQTSESAPYEKHPYRKIVDTFYTDPWMDGQTTFADGARVQWQLIDQIRQTQKTKRNARGKTKTKTKRKQRTHLSVQLALPEKDYNLSGEVVEKQGTTKIKLTPGEKRASVKVHRVARLDSAETVEPRHLIDTIAEAYRHAAPTPKKDQGNRG